MKTMKLIPLMFAVAAPLGFCGPAAAGPVTPVTVSNVAANWSQGEGLSLNTEDIYYAGPISLDVNGFPVIVFCDDLYNNIYIGSTNNFWQTDQAGANGYLSPALALSPLNIEKIAGLAFLGTQSAYANTLTPQQGAAFQVAIWELEYSGLTATDAGFQGDVSGLIGNALNDFNAFTAAGWTYNELESPCDSSLVGSITYTSSPYNGVGNCQIQGQFLAIPGRTVTRIPVPEPVTLSLYGAGLFGAAAVRRRKSKPT